MTASAWSFTLGGFFTLIGIGFILWGRREASQLEEALSQQRDLREFMEHTPESPQPGALATGGVISLALGIGLIAAGFFLR
jgi:hypothetical protein